MNAKRWAILVLLVAVSTALTGVTIVAATAQVEEGRSLVVTPPATSDARREPASETKDWPVIYRGRVLTPSDGVPAPEASPGVTVDGPHGPEFKPALEV